MEPRGSVYVWREVVNVILIRFAFVIIRFIIRAMEGSALVQKEIARLQPQLIEAAINAEAGFVNL